MYVYAIGILPLIKYLPSPESWTQLWYADDASAGGLLKDLQEQFLLLCSHEADFGYFLEPLKCFVVESSQQSLANDIFGHLGTQIVTGHTILGQFY